MFSIQYQGTSTLMQKAINRYLKQFFLFGQSTVGSSLTLTLTVQDESGSLYLGVDESYTLTASSSGASLNSTTVFGAMKGLETFSQLLDWSSPSSTYLLSRLPLQISDAPRFPWRGLLIDSSRHFLPVSAIKRQIDALSYTKLNTLHWHITDAQSFPIYSASYPNLSAKGAYAPSAIYSTAEVQDIISYGYERGVRVVPEFDIPGHAASWGASDPALVVNCTKYNHNINNIPLDPTKEHTYEVLSGFLNEMSKMFLDAVHVGGDEIVFGCWESDPAVSSWMKQHGMTTGVELAQYFEDRLFNSVLPSTKQIVVWQDLFDNGVQIPNNTIIQVWSDVADLKTVTSSGFKGLISAGWYLNEQVPVPGSTHGDFMDTWMDFYLNEPTNGLTPEEASLVLGGEGCIWGEHVDGLVLDAMVWPRTVAIAERLWSSVDVTSTTQAKPRIQEMSCRLQQRGIGSAPLLPGFCLVP
uniref:beta-N-acetylhexosaminidase n=1 Tax=Arcella intermedia TaxID=1963864 RepID=A0A6B2L2K0_9EUKA